LIIVSIEAKTLGNFRLSADDFGALESGALPFANYKVIKP